MLDFPEKYEDEDLKILRDFDGTQMGEYFGGAVCVVDLNGDHLDDLVIAAPQFSLQAANSAQLVGDEGRIYVYINGDRVSRTLQLYVTFHLLSREWLIETQRYLKSFYALYQILLR
jgi:hypothetical protein